METTTREKRIMARALRAYSVASADDPTGDRVWASIMADGLNAELSDEAKAIRESEAAKPKLSSATRAAFRAEVKRSGGVIICDERGEIEVEAPRGSWWSGAGVHCIVARDWERGHPSEGAAYADLIERMRGGLEPCAPDDDNCLSYGCFED